MITAILWRLMIVCERASSWLRLRVVAIWKRRLKARADRERLNPPE